MVLDICISKRLSVPIIQWIISVESENLIKLHIFQGGLTFKAGVPFISASNTASSKLSSRKQHTLGRSEMRQTRWHSFDKCVATPGHVTTCQFFIYRTELQIPFTMTRYVILSNIHISLGKISSINKYHNIDQKCI